MNYFNPKTAAERYVKGRPDFHGNTIQHVKYFLKLDKKVERALDVACGTGLSTKALLEIANNISATDNSAAMLECAHRSKEIQYVLSPAEQQPFEDHEFDLITVCSGVHWFDIDAFLLESSRLLKSKSWLVLYDNFFLGEIEHDNHFKSWHENVYLKKFPAPPRNDKYNWVKQNLQEKGFDFVEEEKFTNAIAFSKMELTRYFTTQSNVISAVENGSTTYPQVEEWLDAELSQFFDGEKAKQTFHFGNWIKYLQRIN